MSELQAPIINWQVKAGKTRVGFTKQRVLMIGQASGTATAKTLIEDVQESEATKLLGANSMARLAFDRFRKHNKRTDIDIIPLATPSGATKAKMVVTVAGTCTEADNLRFRLGDDQFVFEIGIATGATSASVATKLKDSINASTAPFTATAVTGDTSKVSLEFDIAGTFGNGLTGTIDKRVSGIAVTADKFAGGSGAYSTTGIFTSVIGRYQTVIFDSTLSFSTVAAFLNDRASLSNTVKSGIGVCMRTGTVAELKTFGDSKDNQYMVILGSADEMKFNLIPLLAAAEFGAKRALRMTEGAVLGNLTLDAQESYGGAEKASLPYHNTPLSYSRPNNEISLAQLEDLNDSGISLFVPSATGSVLGTVVTTYKKNLAGVDDTTFRYLNAVDTSIIIQEYLFNNCQSEFGQTRATTGELIDGVSMTNTLSIKSFIVGLYVELVGMALAQGGTAAVKAFKKRLVVTLDPATGIYSVNAPVAIVSQFRGLNGVVEIKYDFK